MGTKGIDISLSPFNIKKISDTLILGGMGYSCE